MRVRTAVRAGSWYSGNKDRLMTEINTMYLHKVGPGKRPLPLDQRKDVKNIIGVVSPHAGYACSAPTAAHGFLALAEDRKEVDTVILLGNKHTHHGPEISVASFDAWETPLGQVPVNMSLLTRIINNKQRLSDNLSQLVDFDDTAHMDEHSIELQIPFLQDVYSEFKIAPIAIGRLPTTLTQSFGYYLAEMIKEEGIEDSTIAIASSDMTHGNYSPILNHDEVSSLDKLALTPMLNRDPEALEEIVRKNNISMCGVGPVKVLLSFTEKLGAKSAKLLNYSTSGLTCGSRRSVVGYASVVVMKSGN
ncbi:MAG: AmmeMemoRadiSam system protein B [Candidatus Hodarchaeales archaeon]|jgi:AmmeMemoRadiSam system protein B